MISTSPLKIGTTPEGKQVCVDLVRLIDSRALVQANSGGGKSYLLRLIAEQAGAQVQTVVIDPEGEFATLRERLDLILVSPTGEIPANPRTAAPLARRLVEVGSSAVLDLYDLELSQRRAFVRQFLQALIDVPRSLWRPMLIAIDEAHMFCPERSAGEAESTDAVIRLMTLGRKRGFCGILATQRISKLHKDAVAECNNVFIGRTTLDNDQKRAGDVLGLGKQHWSQLRDMSPGQWKAFGPAMALTGVVEFRSARVTTTHPKAGERHKLRPPPASAAVQNLVAELSDLDQRDPDEAITLEQAQEIIARLKREARQAPAMDPETLDAYRQSGRQEGRREAEQAAQQLRLRLSAAEQSMRLIASQCQEFLQLPELPSEPATESIAPVALPVRMPELPVRSHGRPTPAEGVKLPGGERKILTVLAQYPQGRAKTQVALLAGYASNGGGFNNYLSSLRSKGLIAAGGDGLQITTAGLEALGSYDPLPRGSELLAYWLSKLGKCEREVLRLLYRMHPRQASKEALAREIGYEPTGGGFNNALSRLRTLELISGRGQLQASDVFFS